MNQNFIKIITAKELDAANKKKLETVFGKKHAEPQTFVYEVSPEILGGILVIDNGIYYDGTFKSQLAEIKNHLKN